MGAPPGGRTRPLSMSGNGGGTVPIVIRYSPTPRSIGLNDRDALESCSRQLIEGNRHEFEGLSHGASKLLNGNATIAKYL